MNKKFLSVTFVIGLAAFLAACSGSSADAYNEDDPYSENPGNDNGGGGSLGKVGSMVDPRNDKTYKTVRIGSQLWMAEDLLFYNPLWETMNTSSYSQQWSGMVVPVVTPSPAPTVSTRTDESMSLGYTYIEAMNNTTFKDSAYNDGICPPGWHLPTMEEFDELKTFVKTKCDSTSYCSLGNVWEEANTNDFWTSTPANGIRIDTEYGYQYESNSAKAVSFRVDFGSKQPVLAGFASKSAQMSVRCVQGSSTDSVAAYESYVKQLDKYYADIALADSLWQEVKKGAKKYFNPNKEYGYFTDLRDSNVYGYLQIGSYTWMAENLRYYDAPYSYCDSYLSCNATTYQDTVFYYKAGVLYDSSEKNSVCPDGWHLPSNDEWKDLLAATESTGGLLANDGVWNSVMMSPTNSTGFTMVATNKSYGGVQEPGSGNEAQFWSSNELTVDEVRIDTIYVEDTTDVPADTLPADSTVTGDSTDISDSVLVDSDSLETGDSVLTPEIPSRAFVLDTVRTTKEYEFVVKHSFFYGFETTSVEAGSYRNNSNIRCVMDY